MLLCLAVAGMVWRQPHRRAAIVDISPGVESDSEVETSPALQIYEPTGDNYTSECKEESLDSSDFEDMVSTRRRNYTSKESVHDGPQEHAKREEVGQSKEAGQSKQSTPTDADYQVVRRDWDWEERRLRGRLTSNRLKRSYICLRSSCRDELGIPKSFARLEALNHHRVTKHVGSTVIFKDMQAARERVAKFVNAPVCSTKDKNTSKIYAKQYRLEKSAGIQFQAYFQSTCHEHEEAWADQKSSFIDNFIEQGLRDYKARKEGKKVRRHDSFREPKGCIMCQSGPSHCAPMDTMDMDFKGECSQKDSKDASIIYISSSELKGDVHDGKVGDQQEEHGGMGDLDGGEELDDDMEEESKLHDTHAQDDITSPLVSASVSRVDDILDELCDSFTHSLPRSNKGSRIRLVNYSESSGDESEQLHEQLHGGDESVQLHGGDESEQLHGGDESEQSHAGNERDQIHGGDESEQLHGANERDQVHGGDKSEELHESVTTHGAVATILPVDSPSTIVHLHRTQQSMRTRFGGASMLNYAETKQRTRKQRTSKKQGQMDLEIPD